MSRVLFVAVAFLFSFNVHAQFEVERILCLESQEQLGPNNIGPALGALMILDGWGPNGNVEVQIHHYSNWSTAEFRTLYTVDFMELDETGDSLLILGSAQYPGREPEFITITIGQESIANFYVGTRNRLVRRALLTCQFE